MTILIVGEYYSNNLGDPLLCEIVTKIIQKTYPDVKIIPFDLSGKCGMNDYYPINQRTRIIPKRIYKLIKKCSLYKVVLKKQKKKQDYEYLTTPLKYILDHNKIDIVVFAGGEMFMDYFAERIYVIMKLLKNINTIFHACGMYYLSDSSKKIFQRIIKMNNVKSISVRDSYKRFEEIFGKKKISETYDTALLASCFYRPSREQTTDLGIGIIDKEILYNYQVNIIKKLLNSNLNWQMFTNGSEYDYKTALRILKDVGIPEENYDKYLHTRPCNTQELIEEVTTYNHIIAFRMHCQIVAASFGIPSYGIVWDNKVKEFYDKLGLKNYVFPEQELDIDEAIMHLKKTDTDVAEKAKKCGRKSQVALLCDIKKALK